MVKSEFFPASALLRLALCGEVAPAQIGYILPDLQDAPAPDHGYDALIDLSKVTDIDSSFASIAALVRARKIRYQEICPPKRLVILAPGDLTFGICRMVEQMAQGVLSIELHVARDENEALSLLGREETRLDMMQEKLLSCEDQPTTT